MYAVLSDHRDADASIYRLPLDSKLFKPYSHGLIISTVIDAIIDTTILLLILSISSYRIEIT